MEKEPLVSVIVPIYNTEAYLECCLDSIRNQTYKNLEILLINDGSRDGSEEICLRYAGSDRRIRLFHQENSGLSAARNKGLDQMKGEYVVFVDSDDYIAPCMIQVLLDKLLECQVSISSCDYLEVENGDDNTKFDEVTDPEILSWEKFSGSQVLDTIGTDRNVRFVVVPGKMYSKKIFETLRFPVGRIHEDEFVFPGIYTQADSICHISSRLYAYRQSLNSITRKNGGRQKFSEDVLEMRLDRLAFFHQRGITKYDRCTEKQLFSVLAVYLSEEKDRKKAAQYGKEIEKRAYGITGKKFFSWKWALCRLSPGCYGFMRRAALKTLHLLVPSKYENYI